LHQGHTSFWKIHLVTFIKQMIFFVDKITSKSMSKIRCKTIPNNPPTVIEEILQLKIKPKEKQIMLVEAVTSRKISADEFIEFFQSASDVDKGTCADVMKHVCADSPDLLIPHIDTLITYINYKSPRVKWGIPETIGNLAKVYPDKVTASIPFLIKNISDDTINTTVIKWCSAFALTEIAKHNSKTRKQLIPVFEKRTVEEKNNGVRNVFVKAMKVIREQ
jgi:hypothetical protein